MQTLLAILLYMQLIQSPGTYNKVYIDQLEMQYHAQIQIIMADPDQMAEVTQVYMPQAENVVVIDNAEVSNEKPLRDFACTTDNTLPGKQQ